MNYGTGVTISDINSLLCFVSSYKVGMKYKKQEFIPHDRNHQELTSALYRLRYACPFDQLTHTKDLV